MAAFIEFLSAPFFHRPVSPDPYATHWVVGIVYKLHTMTGSLLFVFSSFVFARELFQDHIHCIHDGSDATGGKVPERAMDSYCYISDTFTLPKVIEDHDAPHPGVGPIGTNHDNELIYHNYYMWVPYLLLFQSVTFFIPLLLHRFAQEGKSQLLIAGLHNVIPFTETREDKYGDAKFYFRDYWNQHNWWATKLLFCDMLNLVNIIVNIFITNWYMSREFLAYGILSMSYMTQNPETRGTDPFNLIFPKMTKCTLHTYGPSGTVQNHDGLCVLPINIMNEKIYLIVWFMFMLLGIFTLIHHFIASVIILTPELRKKLLSVYILDSRTDLKRKLARMLDMTSFGDWLMLYMIAKNLDQVTFTELMDWLKYPDYRWDLDENDEENDFLDNLQYHDA